MVWFERLNDSIPRHKAGGKHYICFAIFVNKVLFWVFLFNFVLECTKMKDIII